MATTKIRYSLFARLLSGNVIRRFTAGLPRILMYHGFCGDEDALTRCVPSSIFRNQLIYLKNHFRFYSLVDLIRINKQTGKYPKRAVALTIDDGYMNFYRFAYPILKELHIPATVFVLTGLIDRRDWIWVDKIWYLWDKGGIKTVEERVSLFTRLFRAPVDCIGDALNSIQERSNVSIPSQPPTKYELMGWKEIEEISRSGFIDIGSHTLSHPILSSTSDEKAWEEIALSKIKITEKIGLPVSSFAFPNGSIRDFCQGHLLMLKKAGYKCAVSTIAGFVDAKSNPYMLPRVSGSAERMDAFTGNVDGLYFFKQYFKRLFQQNIDQVPECRRRVAL